MIGFFAAVPFLLGSWVSLIPIAAGIALHVLRTALEDRTLLADLPGYRDYAARVRYRLMPSRVLQSVRTVSGPLPAIG